MREFIDIIEAATNRAVSTRFYHASKDDLPNGTILTPRGSNMSDDEVEAVLEKYRPIRRPERDQSVYMVRDPRTLDRLSINSGFYLYEVRPARPVVMLDYAWVNEIYRLLSSNEEKGIDNGKDWVVEAFRRSSRGYWSGQGRMGVASVWEFLAPSATIISKIDPDTLGYP